MSDDKRWIVVVPEQAVSAESEVDAVGLVYSLGLARVSAGVTEYPPDVRSLRVRPDAPPPSPVESWPSFKIEPPPVAHYFGSDALRTELAKLQRATLTLGAHVPREFAPLYAAAQDAKAAAFAVGELVRWGVPQPEPGPGPVTTEILKRHAATDPPRPPGVKVVGTFQVGDDPTVRDLEIDLDTGAVTELPTAPTVTPDAALAVMVGLDRGADGGEPTASRAGIDDPVVVPPGYSLDIGPWEPGDDDDYDYDDDDPSPWRPLPDPECPADALVWVTFSERRGVRLARAATMRRWADGTLRWYTQGIGGHKIELTEVLAWMPLPEPWRGGR